VTTALEVIRDPYPGRRTELTRSATLTLSSSSSMLSSSSLYVILCCDRFHFVFIEPPSIQMHQLKGSGSFSLPNVSLELQCVVTGFPVPNVTWLWQPCLSFGCQASDTAWNEVKLAEDNLVSIEVPYILEYRWIRL